MFDLNIRVIDVRMFSNQHNQIYIIVTLPNQEWQNETLKLKLS